MCNELVYIGRDDYGCPVRLTQSEAEQVIRKLSQPRKVDKLEGATLRCEQAKAAYLDRLVAAIGG